MHAGLATVFTPEDLYIATLVGALNQLNCGTTTLADWCHNNPTPAHNDAAIDGLLAIGHPRRVLPRQPKPDPKPGQSAVLGGAASARRDRAPAEGAPGPRAADIQAAMLGPHYSTLEVAMHDFRMAPRPGPDRLAAPGRRPGAHARRLGAAGGRRPARRRTSTSSTATRSTTRSSQRFCDLGMSFSAAAESEMSQGHGHPLTGRLRRFGRAPSLGVDLESVLSGDMLTQARIALGIQRSLDNVAYREAHGTIPPTSTITTREALSWVTVEGARDAEAGAPHRLAGRRQAGGPGA